jgi:hypothetical protein
MTDVTVLVSTTDIVYTIGVGMVWASSLAAIIGVPHLWRRRQARLEELAALQRAYAAEMQERSRLMCNEAWHKLMEERIAEDFTQLLKAEAMLNDPLND